MRRLTRRGLALALPLFAVLAALWVSPPAAVASESFPFAEDETIHLIVPYRAGGGFDRVARLMQPWIAKSLSAAAGREVAVVVENRKGAGGRRAYEYLYASPADSARMVLLDNQGAGLQQVALGAEFDLAKFTYLGRVNKSDPGILVRKDLGITSMAQLLERAAKQPILFGTGGAGGADHIANLILQATLKENGLDLPMDFVHFNGSKEVLASMNRGEAEAFLGSVSSTLRAVNDGYAVNAVVFAEERNRFAPDVLTAFEQEVPGAQIVVEAAGVSRVLIGPPGMPEARAKVLSEAIREALHDPEFLAAAKEAKLPVIYASPADSREVVMQHTKALLQHEDKVRAALGGS